MDYLKGMRNAPPVLRMGIPFDTLAAVRDRVGGYWGRKRGRVSPKMPAKNKREKIPVLCIN